MDEDIRKEGMKYKVSIIIPVYNTASYLRKCLDSVLNQSCPSIQIIVINDGSTDDSKKILDEYSKRQLTNLQIVHRENRGIGYTRNQGIELAVGEYMTFIDSDDSIEPDFCLAMYHMAEAENLDVVACDYKEVDENGKTIKKVKIFDFGKTTLEQSPQILFDINTSPWNKIYKTRLIKRNNIKFPEELKYEDVFFTTGVLCGANRIGKINKELVNYLVRAGSETMVVNNKVFDIFTILNLMKDILKQSELYENVREYYEWFCINRITVYCIQQVHQKNGKIAMQFLDKSYQYLEENFGEWRENRLYKENNGWKKRVIKSNKYIMKLYIMCVKRRG